MLIDIIREHANEFALTGDFEAVSSVLSEKILVRDDTPVSYARLAAELGDDVRAMVAGTIRKVAASEHPLAGEVADAHVVLLNERVGLRIDSDTRQQTIDLLAAVGEWPDSVRNAIKENGKRIESLAGRTVTAEECRNAWQAAEVFDWFAAQSAVIRERISSHEILTRQAIIDLLLGVA